MATNESSRQLYSVNQLADELGITARTIRFYEASGLITPRRAGGNRVFDRRDRARLMMILRGKRLGFALSEIRDYLDLYEADRGQVSQMQLLLALTRKRMGELRQQRLDLDQTLADLGSIERKVIEALDQRGASPDNCVKLGLASATSRPVAGQQDNIWPIRASFD